MTKVHSQARTDRKSKSIKGVRFTPTWKKNLSKAKKEFYRKKLNREIQSTRMKLLWQTNATMRLKRTLAKEKKKLSEVDRSYKGWKHNGNQKMLKLLKSKYGNVCWYCGLDLKRFKYAHTDHIKPKIEGGSYNIENRALTCPMCNFAKHDMPLNVLLQWFEHIRSNEFKTYYKNT